MCRHHELFSVAGTSLSSSDPVFEKGRHLLPCEEFPGISIEMLLNQLIHVGSEGQTMDWRPIVKHGPMGGG